MVAAGKMLTAILSHAPDKNGLTRFINELRTAQKALRDQEQELGKAHDELEIKVDGTNLGTAQK